MPTALTTLEIGPLEVDVEIEFDYEPFERQTRDHPGNAESWTATKLVATWPNGCKIDLSCFMYDLNNRDTSLAAWADEAVGEWIEEQRSGK